MLPRHADPVAIAVRDAETGRPIAGAEVELCDPLFPHKNTAKESHGVTGPDGVVRLDRPEKTHTSELVETKASGYFLAVQDLRSTADEPEPTPAAERRSPDVVIALYAEPRPTVELVVPEGYRGLIKAAIVLREPQPADKPGQRQFAFTVSPAGTVEVAGPPVLRYAIAFDYRARYANGVAVKSEVGAEEVGFRWVKTGGHTEYFVVGTKQECEDVRRSLEGDPERQRSYGGGESKPGGGGRGGRHGGRGGR